MQRNFSTGWCTMCRYENTFYRKRTHSIARERILLQENAFYRGKDAEEFFD